MRFQDFIDEQKARKASPDKQLAKSLAKMSDRHIEVIKKLELTETSASTVMTTYYESLREIIEAIAAMRGYKVYSHEAFTYFLKEIGETSMSDKFDRFRKIRNGINYYGKQIDKASAESSIRDIEEMITKLKEKFLENMSGEGLAKSGKL